jgi:hypothetical protein
MVTALNVVASIFSIAAAVFSFFKVKEAKSIKDDITSIVNANQNSGNVISGNTCNENGRDGIHAKQ